jgi:hypothetical protein
MLLQCPRCNSSKIASFHQAMKIAAAIGTVGGAARGVSTALAGGQLGATVGALAGPLGITLGTISGALLGGLVGGAGGCTLGAQLGDKLERYMLAHNLCLIFGSSFQSTCLNRPPLLSFITSRQCHAMRGIYAGLHPLAP